MKMDKLNEQEYLFKHQLEKERLKRAEQLFQHRLIYTSVIFILILIMLVVLMEGASRGTQWFCLIIYIVAAVIALGSISNRYSHEKDEARK
jgi:hypothetical protein